MSGELGGGIIMVRAAIRCMGIKRGNKREGRGQGLGRVEGGLGGMRTGAGMMIPTMRMIMMAMTTRLRVRRKIVGAVIDVGFVRCINVRIRIDGKGSRFSGGLECLQAPVRGTRMVGVSGLIHTRSKRTYIGVRMNLIPD